MYITGSTSLKYYIPTWRLPRDIDYIATDEEYNQYIEKNKEKIVTIVPTKRGNTIHMLGSVPIEFEIANNNNSTEQLIDILNFTIYRYDTYIPPFIVLALKMSHRYLKNSPHFKKTMDDIIELKKLGYVIPEKLKGWLKYREKETYDYSHPKLNRTKFDFFDTATGIQYVYDHDSIHESVKHFSHPAYTLIKENQTDVFCSKEKFFSLPETIKLFTVLEESYTLALERSQIPNNFEVDRKKSFMIALEKVCTSISSGWWREYAYDNYYQVLELYDEGYVDKFHFGLKNGVVKPYEGK